jgi:antitoxin (DNA-binding transcriptional repressor) of toxin-antitoxin stability system
MVGYDTLLQEDSPMPFVTLSEAQARLPELIANLVPGEELCITQDQQTIAKLVRIRPPLREPRQPGSAKDTILYMADDFDAPLEDFREYME